MPTGGVDLTPESVGRWIAAGAAAVGMGSSLIRSEWVDARNFDAVAQATRDVSAWVEEARG